MGQNLTWQSTGARGPQRPELKPPWLQGASPHASVQGRRPVRHKTPLPLHLPRSVLVTWSLTYVTARPAQRSAPPPRGPLCRMQSGTKAWALGRCSPPGLVAGDRERAVGTNLPHGAPCPRAHTPTSPTHTLLSLTSSTLIPGPSPFPATAQLRSPRGFLGLRVYPDLQHHPRRRLCPCAFAALLLPLGPSWAACGWGLLDQHSPPLLPCLPIVGASPGTHF